MGLDLGQLPECLAAMDRAEDMRPPAISYAKIPGLDGTSDATIYMFDDAHNEKPSSAISGAPPRLSDGFVLGMFQLRDVIKSALEVLQPAGVDIYLFDVTNAQKTQPILAFPSPIRATELPAMAYPPPESSAPLHYETRITVADRTWLAYCLPTDVYFSGKSRRTPWAALLAGLLITGLIVGYLFLLTERTVQVEKLVSERTWELQASEKRFRLLVENAADAFFLNDQDGNVLDCNQRACEQLGYSRDELLRMNVFDFEVAFQPEDHHERVWNYHPEEAYPVNVDGLHRRKDGSIYPVEVRLNYLEAGGKGFIMADFTTSPGAKRPKRRCTRNKRFLRHLIDLPGAQRKLMAYEIRDGLAQRFDRGLVQAAKPGRRAPAAGFFLGPQSLGRRPALLIRESADEAQAAYRWLASSDSGRGRDRGRHRVPVREHRQSGQFQIEFAHQVQFHRLSAPLEVALFRVAQECLTNACRHSQSPSIRVELSRLENGVRLSVQDWGVGFDPREVKGQHTGLRNPRARPAAGRRRQHRFGPRQRHNRRRGTAAG